MTIFYRIYKKGLITSILFFAIGFVGLGQSQFNQMEDAVALTSQQAQSDSLAKFGPYEEPLLTLAEQFKKSGFDINSLLMDSRFEIYEKIGDRFRNSAEVKSSSHEEYKERLGYEYKRKNMIEFMQKHSSQLSTAEGTYGISKFVISAIIGVESDFGKNIGSHNPFNSYVSMYAVDYRKEFAEAQLRELLEFTRRNNIDVLNLKSSYAGAVSYAQFIPYSLNKWFVGEDLYDMTNNIMSVANYLAYFKERTGDIETAVLRYNPSRRYVEAVMELAQTTEEQYPGS